MNPFHTMYANAAWLRALGPAAASIFGSRGMGPLPNAGVRVQNPDGSFSTERTIGTNIDGREYVLPTLLGGVQVPPETAVRVARRTGLNKYPSFTTPDQAEKYAAWRSSELGRRKGAARQ